MQAMSPTELLDRSADFARKQRWMARPPRPPELKSQADQMPIQIPAELASGLHATDWTSTLEKADQLLNGQWTMFDINRTDVDANVDYYYDPATQRRSPSDVHAFRINHRDEPSVGNIKNIWELARHQHLTTLAAAFTISKDERYAERVAKELNNFITATPFCRGIHWTSGIELGIRMISWVWIRRLLDGWANVDQLFEKNPIFVHHLGRHHQWVDSFPATGSSANNHLLAERCGIFIAASAFDLFKQSDQWREQAAENLAMEFHRQTFDDGLNKELASDYHGFVLELVTLAYAEAKVTGHPLAEDLSKDLLNSLDAVASVLDCAGDAHHQGDADEGYGLLVEPIGFNRWHSLLKTGSAIADPPAWWPEVDKTDLRSAVLRPCIASASRSVEPLPPERPTSRTNQFGQAGQTFLRDLEPGPDELWVRFDHGPHGFLSTAAHAHADALAIEARVGGVPILVDPGTYCYHGEPVWRDYFRSTAAHSTVEIGGRDQSQIEGPFLWDQHCVTTLVTSSGLDDGPVASCTARHTGYQSRFALDHQRTVKVDRQHRSIAIFDELLPSSNLKPTSVRVRFHFHPNVTIHPRTSADDTIFALQWPSHDNHPEDTVADQGKLVVDRRLKWSLTKGQTAPPMGWYSRVLGHREPSWVLVGETTVEAQMSFSTTLTF